LFFFKNMFINRESLKILKLFLMTMIIVKFGFISRANASETQSDVISKDSPKNLIATENHQTRTSEGLPTHRRDGGSRSNGSCLAGDRDLVALIPDKIVGMTASISPKLFFYVPETTEPKTLEFVLRNEDDKLVYETFLAHNGRSGIVDLEIPATIGSSLNSKPNYHWYLSMICNPQQRSRDIVVEGWMQRVKIDSQIRQQLTKANTLQQVAIYQRQGLWYDALSILATSKATTPTPAIAQKWTELLQSIGLPELSLEPLVEDSLVSFPSQQRTPKKLR
jgi:hypothetical protein